MTKTALFSLFIAFTMLSGCENAEMNQCKEKASKLWDPKEDDSKKQKAYWNAIKKCKEKHG